MQKCEEPGHSLGHACGGKNESTQRGREEGAEQDGVCSSDEQHHQRCRSDQSGGAEIDLSDDERNEQRRCRERNDKAKNQIPAEVLKTSKPPRQKKYRGDLGNLRRLKCDWAGPDPATRAVNA